MSAPNQDQGSLLHPVQHLAPASYTSTQTPGTGVDLAGYESATALINVGAYTSGSFAFTLEESDSASSSFAAIAAAALHGDSLPTVDASGKALQIYNVGIIRSKRYVRCVATSSSGNMVFGVEIVRGNKRHE